jgi:hypothetical protein
VSHADDDFLLRAQEIENHGQLLSVNLCRRRVPRNSTENIISITNISKQYLLQPVNYVVIYTLLRDVPGWVRRDRATRGEHS